jgi:hypothetical protein
MTKAKTKKTTTKKKLPFMNITINRTINQVKAKKTRKKKFKAPKIRLKVFPKTKPQNSLLYKMLVK